MLNSFNDIFIEEKNEKHKMKIYKIIQYLLPKENINIILYVWLALNIFLSFLKYCPTLELVRIGTSLIWLINYYFNSFSFIICWFVLFFSSLPFNNFFEFLYRILFDFLIKYFLTLKKSTLDKNKGESIKTYEVTVRNQTTERITQRKNYTLIAEFGSINEAFDSLLLHGVDGNLYHFR